MSLEIDLDALTGSSPYDWDVPHPSWRPNQWDALQQILDMYDEETGSYIIAELPTGSGKSAIPTALGKKQKVAVFVHSLALLDQYRDNYGFTIVKGMAQYPCVNPDVVDAFMNRHQRKPRVSECPFEPRDECPYYMLCPYIIAREKALAARRMACTYPFALLSYRVQARGGIGVWDEAHAAVEAIIQLSAVKFDQKFRTAWGLPKFPSYGVRDVLGKIDRGRLLDWFSDSLRTVQGSRPNDIFIEDVSAWRGALDRLTRAKDKIDSKEDYYFESFKEERTWIKKGKEYKKDVEYIMFKPFSAASLSWKLSRAKNLNILMSATIGSPAPLAKELGIQSFHFMEYPHPVPIDKRPVYDLGFERMIWSNIERYPQLFKFQARKIAKFLDEFPPEWRGLILCSSYFKVDKLTPELAPFLKDRLYVPKTGDKVGEFLSMTDEGKVVIDVIQVWGQGLDLYGDKGRFSIVASVPFGNLMERYEQVRKKRVGSDYAWWFSYMSVPQAVGRVTRGEIEDDEYVLNVGAIADGSATTKMAYKNYPRWFKEAIVKY